MQWNYEHHPLKAMFSGLVEHAFCVEVGVCEPKVTDYLVSMLLDFIHVDHLNKMMGDQSHCPQSVSDLLRLLESQEIGSETAGERDVHRYIGDFTLFWTGLFPEGLRRHQTGLNPDGMIDFVGQGKESYAIASRLFKEDCEPPGSVFRRLSTDFELCVHGLGLVRQGWEQREADGWDDNPHLLY